MRSDRNEVQEGELNEAQLAGVTGGTSGPTVNLSPSSRKSTQDIINELQVDAQKPAGDNRDDRLGQIENKIVGEEIIKEHLKSSDLHVPNEVQHALAASIKAIEFYDSVGSTREASKQLVADHNDALNRIGELIGTIDALAYNPKHDLTAAWKAEHDKEAAKVAAELTALTHAFTESLGDGGTVKP